MKANKNGFYCCHWCNKKYKTVEKFSKHIEQTHPFMTLKKNNFKLTLEDKIWILDAFESYTNILSDINTSSFDEATKKLNMSNDAHKLFQKRINDSELLAKSMSDTTQLMNLFDEFGRFLNLGLTWRQDNFCPSMVIDLIWHSAMMDTVNYSHLCNKLFGQVLSHCLEENEEHNKDRFEKFEKQFVYHHGASYIKVSDLIYGSENAIHGMRRLLIAEKENNEKEKEKVRLANIEREKERQKQMEIQRQRYSYHSFSTGKYRDSEYRDDGKC